MNKEKRKVRRMHKRCKGCDRDFSRKDYNEHILEIIRGMRQ